MPDPAPKPNRDAVIPYGKHKGKTLDAVASTNGGLIYLDKQREREWLRETHPELAETINAYLEEPAVARELDQALRG